MTIPQLFQIVLLFDDLVIFFDQFQLIIIAKRRRPTKDLQYEPYNQLLLDQVSDHLVRSIIKVNIINHTDTIHIGIPINDDRYYLVVPIMLSVKSNL